MVPPRQAFVMSMRTAHSNTELHKARHSLFILIVYIIIICLINLQGHVNCCRPLINTHYSWAQKAFLLIRPLQILFWIALFISSLLISLGHCSSSLCENFSSGAAHNNGNQLLPLGQKVTAVGSGPSLSSASSSSSGVRVQPLQLNS